MEMVLYHDNHFISTSPLPIPLCHAMLCHTGLPTHIRRGFTDHSIVSFQDLDSDVAQPRYGGWPWVLGRLRPRMGRKWQTGELGPEVDFEIAEQQIRRRTYVVNGAIMWLRLRDVRKRAPLGNSLISILKKCLIWNMIYGFVCLGAGFTLTLPTHRFLEAFR